MAFQLSPGVNVSEIDKLGFIPAVASTGAAFVGQFAWGPVEDYTLISTKKELEKIFGKPTDVNYRDWFTCSNFLEYSNNLNVVRVVDVINSKNSTVDGNGVLIKNITDYSQQIGTEVGGFAARYPGSLGDSIKVVMLDAATWGVDPTMKKYEDLFDAKPGTSEYVANVNGENDELHIVIVDELGYFTGIPGAILETYEFVSKAKDAVRLDGEPAFYGSIIEKQSKYVYFLTVPDSSKYAIGGAITAITVTSGGAGYTQTPTVDITGDGSGATATATLATTGSVKSITVTAGGTGYVDAETVTLTGDTTGSIATATVVDGDIDGIVDSLTILSAGSGFQSGETVTISGGSGTGLTATIEVGFAVESVTVASNGADYTDAGTTVTIVPDATDVGTVTDATVSANIVPGADYDSDWNTQSNGGKFKSLAQPWETQLSGGVNSTTIDENELMAGWDMFRNAEVVDVSLLILGDAGENSTATTHTTIVKHVIDNIAEYRKDCVVFFSPKHADVVNVPENTALENIITTRNNINSVSSYAFMDSGWKYQYDLFNDKYRWVPLNGDIAGVCAQTDLARDPWWSPAGYTRGQLKNVIKLAFNPNKASRDELYKRGINPVVSFVGEGVLLYGDKTQLTKPSAFQKLNIRRLFIVLEKAIAKASKYQLFEFNDTFTRANFVSMVEPYLRDVQGRRGIQDFKVVCDETNNTAEVINRSEFVADIYIRPTYSINYIQLNFVAVRNGVEFDEVIGVASTNI
jgi:phage tail sheath protein FI